MPPSPFAQGRELGVVFVCFLSLLNPPPFARLLHRLTLPDRPRTSVLNQFTSLCLHGHQSHASLHRITPTVANIASALVPPRAVLIPSPSSGRGSSNRNWEPFSDDSATLRLALAPFLPTPSCCAPFSTTLQQHRPLAGLRSPQRRSSLRDFAHALATVWTDSFWSFRSQLRSL